MGDGHVDTVGAIAKQAARSSIVTGMAASGLLLALLMALIVARAG